MNIATHPTYETTKGSLHSRGHWIYGTPSPRIR